MNIKLILDKEIYENIFSQSSSFDLGVAVSSIAIVVAIVEIVYNKSGLKVRFKREYKKIAYYLALVSIFITFIAEFASNKFTLQILGAIFMIISIIMLIDLIFPIKSIKEIHIKKLKKVLDGILPNTNFRESDEQVIKDIVFCYKDLLNLSLTDKKTQEIFYHYFTSNIFLTYFSKSGYVFQSTIDFYLENKKEGKNIDYFELFFEKLFIKSLEKKDSFLNVFNNEEVYPNSISPLDEILLKDEQAHLLFNGMILSFHQISDYGQISYLGLMSRYFDLVGRGNSYHSAYGKGEQKYPLNEELTKMFFKNIIEIMSSVYGRSPEHKKNIISSLSMIDVLHHYQYSIKIEDRSNDLREKTGEFLYKVYDKMLLGFDVYQNKDEFQHSIRNIYEYLVRDDEMAKEVFIEKMKEKIIGIKDDYGSNKTGGYPAMVLIFFQIFGHGIFSKEREKDKFQVEILKMLAESFPKLHDGFIRWHYEKDKLPVNEKIHLQKKGREIIKDFILDSMEYNRDKNSLIYTFGFGDKTFGSTEVLLDDVVKNNKIEVIKL